MGQVQEHNFEHVEKRQVGEILQLVDKVDEPHQHGKHRGDADQGPEEFPGEVEMQDHALLTSARERLRHRKRRGLLAM